jgi:4-amino-4-deoxy-L-arabinose transferase-like glycosyltransferase
MPRRFWILGLLFALLVWFLPLGFYDLFNPDEGRYAEIPREMVATGDWVTPRLNAIKYFEKPPLQYWATAAADELLGEHAWTARLWAALTGACGVLLTWWLGRRVYGSRVGHLAALVQAGSLLYLGLARITTLDMGLCFTLQIAMTGLVLLAHEHGAARSRRAAIILGLGVALAFLSKGLVGILIPGAVAALYVPLSRDWALPLRARPWWTLAALSLIAAPWVFIVSGRNPEFARFFFIHEHFQRFLTRAHDRWEPDWFFIPVLLVGFMPWTTLLPGIAVHAWRACRAADRVALVLTIWAAFVFAFFSLSQSKLIPYILPMFPALALLAGGRLVQMESRRLARHFWLVCAVWVSIALAAMTLWQLRHAPFMRAFAEQLEEATTSVVLELAGAMLLAGLTAGVAAALAARRGALAAVCMAALGAVSLVGVGLYSAQYLPRTQRIAELVRRARPLLGKDTQFYCVGDYEQSIPFYLQRTCTLVGYRGELEFGLQQEPWRWIADLQQFASRWRANTDALAMVRPSAYAQLQGMGLPMRVIYTAPSIVAVVRE